MMINSTKSSIIQPINTRKENKHTLTMKSEGKRKGKENKHTLTTKSKGKMEGKGFFVKM